MNAKDTNLLLISGSGFLGSYLSQSLRTTFSTFKYSTRQENYDREGDRQISLHLDKAIVHQLKDHLKNNKFSAAVICAAISDPNDCIQNPTLSQKVNVEAVKEMGSLFEDHGIKTIFFSSDLVFGGQKDLCTESEETCPTTLYGRQKVAAEEYLLKNHPNSLIFRVSKLMSVNPHPRNMLNPILSALLQKQEAKLFTDQYTTPLFIEDIPGAIASSLNKNLCGIYHLGIKSKYSRYEIGLKLSELLQKDPEKIQPFQMKDFSFSEKRGPTNTLISKKFEDATGFHFREFEDFLPELQKNMVFF